jgi:cell wall-associated NlpC family hydrolase
VTLQVAAHRRPRPRSLSGGTTRAAVTIVLAGAATATGLDGTGQAAPAPSPAQVEARVDKLYREAEVATEKYNGAQEKAATAEKRLRTLGEEAARRQQRLNAARDALGTIATAQYRAGGIDPAMALLLSADPQRYLEDAEFTEREGVRQTAQVADARKQLREIEQLRGAARIELASLRSRQAELRRQKETITGKLGEARRLLSRLSPQQRAALGEDGARASREGAAAREALTARRAVAAPTSRAAAAVAYAYRKLGSPYVWGATGPDAFDCSGLVQAAYRAAGVSLPRTTYAQIGAGRRVPRSELRPGDLVFFYSGISHVGIYVGDGQMIHAPNPSAPVRLAPIDEMPFAGATRVA